MRGRRAPRRGRLDPVVGSVASVFMSRWDVAVPDQVPARPAGQARSRDRAADLPGVPRAHGLRRWQRLAERRRPHAAAPVGEHEHEGPEALRTTSTCTCLGAPFTVNTVPEATLRAFFDHGHVGKPMPADGGDADATLAAFRRGRRRRRRARREAPDRTGRRASSTPGTTSWPTSTSRARRCALERAGRSDGHGQRHDVPLRAAPGVGGPRAPLRRDPRPAPARPVRRGSRRVASGSPPRVPASTSTTRRTG